MNQPTAGYVGQIGQRLGFVDCWLCQVPHIDACLEGSSCPPLQAALLSHEESH